MTVWTEEMVTKLRNMWDEGLSATQVADRLGSISRNAVIGKVHRLGLTKRGNDANKHLAKMATVKYRKSQRSLNFRAKRSSSDNPTIKSRNLSMGGKLNYDLLANDATPFKPRTFQEMVDNPKACKWPLLRSEKPTMFCGDCNIDGKYCEFHSRMSLAQ